MNEETIYMGTPMSENASESNGFKANAWKPITIGGVAGILIGAGALIANQAQANPEQAKPAAGSEPDNDAVPQKTANDTPVAQDNTASELNITTVADDLSFEDAFATARDQVGPGGVFYWRGVIFSTYTVDEWNELTDEQHEYFALQVRPEVDANSIDLAELEPDQIYPVDDEEENMAFAEIMDEESVGMDEDVAIADVQNDEIVADIAYVEGQDEQQVMSHINADMQDAMAMIYDDDVQEADEDLAMEETGDIQDVVMGESDIQEAVSDMAFASVPSKEPVRDVEPAPADVHVETIAKADDEDNEVHIVGYGQSDGHMIMGLDMNGDNEADILVIDVDDSGSYTDADIVIDSDGNMSTYGELVDFANDQIPADDNNQTIDMQANQPGMGHDMPDYMDDAIPQV